MTAIGPGCQVTMHYCLCREDGIEVDNSHGGEPLVFTVGDGTLAAGLEELLFGLPAGTRGSYAVAPGQLFGLPDPDNVHALPRDDFPAEIVLEPGLVLSFSAPSGDEIPGTVLELDEARVTVDFNHPLAGHPLRFDVEIIAVVPTKP